jgi:hypothetical protein
VLAAVFLSGWWKHGFVHHDEIHSVPFFAAAICAALAFGWPRTGRGYQLGTLAPMGVLAATFLAAASRSPYPDSGAVCRWRP